LQVFCIRNTSSNHLYKQKRLLFRSPNSSLQSAVQGKRAMNNSQRNFSCHWRDPQLYVYLYLEKLLPNIFISRIFTNFRAKPGLLLKLFVFCFNKFAGLFDLNVTSDSFLNPKSHKIGVINRAARGFVRVF
jgi:hypothetical protein